MEGPETDESSRLGAIFADYRRRERAHAKWSLRTPGNRILRDERRDLILAALSKGGFSPISKQSILEVGCGNGSELAGLVKAGARPENLLGVDILEPRILGARTTWPELRFEVEDARHLSDPDASRDVVFVQCVLSSVLDDEVAERIASEMWRVLRPGGAVLWYDFRYPSPFNRNVRAMTRRRIARLFPHARIDLKTVSVAPPLLRAAGRFAPAAQRILRPIPFVRTHHLGLLTKPERRTEATAP